MVSVVVPGVLLQCIDIQGARQWRRGMANELAAAWLEVVTESITLTKCIQGKT